MLDDGRSEIEIEDLLLALTSDETSVPLLAVLGIDVVAMRAAIERQRAAGEEPHSSAKG